MRAAGLTPDGVVRALPRVVSRSVLYDWKKGEHLPAGTGPLVAVVELCLGRAGRDPGLGSAPGDVDGWLRLLAEAKQSRDTEVERHRMPRRPSASAAGTHVGVGQQVSEGWPAEQWGRYAWACTGRSAAPRYRCMSSGRMIICSMRC
ncbi:hypothetical protein AB0L00_44055 [Actinoallomurus sp. NPDC052308]|uniref:hypothetical protein n=1 Tax=Actinoallomurus sp. NPDC052308 TaxID=3155530 RepID=UPI003418DC47